MNAPRRQSRAAVPPMHQLERCGEMLAPMLVSIHNVQHDLSLMREMRAALKWGGSPGNAP